MKWSHVRRLHNKEDGMGRLSRVFPLVTAVWLAAACLQMKSEAIFTAADRTSIHTTREAALSIANGTKDWREYTSTYYDANAVSLPPGVPAVRGR